MLDDPAYRAHLAIARRPAGGDARLLGLQQGVGLPRGRLAAPRRAVGAGRGRGRAWRGADPVPRPRRRDRAGRGTDEPRHPRPGRGIGGRPAQAHRAGRGHRRELLRRGDRPAPSRAGDRGRPPRLDARPRRRARGGPLRRRPDHGRAGRDVAGRLSRARPRRPGVRDLLPRHHADRGAVRRCGWGRDRRLAAAPTGATVDRQRSGRSRGRSPGRSRGSTCPAGSGSAPPSSGTATRTARPVSMPSPGSGATGRSCAACSTTPR